MALAETVVEDLSPQLIDTDTLVGEFVSWIVPLSVSCPLDVVVEGTEKFVNVIDGRVRSSRISRPGRTVGGVPRRKAGRCWRELRVDMWSAREAQDCDMGSLLIADEVGICEAVLLKLANYSTAVSKIMFPRPARMIAEPISSLAA